MADGAKKHGVYHRPNTHSLKAKITVIKIETIKIDISFDHANA